MLRYWLLLTILLLMLATGVWVYETGSTIWAQVQLTRHGRLTQATVMGLVEHRSEENVADYTLRLRFVTAAGAVVWAGSRQGYDSLTYRVGQAVALRYLPRDPELCLTETERTDWWSSLLELSCLTFSALLLWRLRQELYPIRWPWRWRARERPGRPAPD